MQVKKEEKNDTEIVLTKPLSLEGESSSDASYKAPNLLQRIIGLFKNVRPGSDLTRFQVSCLPSIQPHMGIKYQGYLLFLVNYFIFYFLLSLENLSILLWIIILSDISLYIYDL